MYGVVKFWYIRTGQSLAGTQKYRLSVLSEQSVFYASIRRAQRAATPERSPTYEQLPLQHLSQRASAGTGASLGNYR